MKISGFTITRNAIKFNYPVLESIRSILPICDEFIVNVGDSEDGTLELIQSIGDAKIRIIQNVWDLTQGSEVLSHQTNLALRECTGDWAFYLQSDEVIHEADLPKLKAAMRRYLNNPKVDALRFRWLHFYGSYFRYRIDRGWYQKQDRVIRLRPARCGATPDSARQVARTDEPGVPVFLNKSLEETGTYLFPPDFLRESKYEAKREVPPSGGTKQFSEDGSYTGTTPPLAGWGSIRNNGEVESFGDAFGFRRKDGQPLRRMSVNCLLYHYGWVHPEVTMTERRVNAEIIGFTALGEDERQGKYDYGDLRRFPPYFGSHPAVMRPKIGGHELSQADLKEIHRQYWWHPLKWLKVRYKTGRRVKEKIV